MNMATENRRFSESRPLLILNENARISSVIEHVISSIKPCKLDRLDLRSEEKSLTEEEIRTCHVAIKFNEETTAADRRRGYVIGLVQEPCNDYLNLWAVGSKGYGHDRKDLFAQGLPESLYGQDPPQFNSVGDKDRFRLWVAHPLVQGILAKRMSNSYGYNLEGLDCIIFAENLYSSFLQCISGYALQGGYVNWETPEIREVMLAVEQERKRQPHNTAKVVSLEETRVNYHDQCDSFFTRELADMLENGPERFIYHNFGYSGCCSKDHYNSSYILSHQIKIQETINGDGGGVGWTALYCSVAACVIFALAVIAHRRATKKGQDWDAESWSMVSYSDEQDSHKCNGNAELNSRCF